MKIFRYFFFFFINKFPYCKDNLGLLSYCLCICLSYILALLFNHELTMHDYRIIVAGFMLFCLSLIHLYLKDNAPHCKKDLIYNVFLLLLLLLAKLFIYIFMLVYYCIFHLFLYALVDVFFLFVCCCRMKIIMFLKYVKKK